MIVFTPIPVAGLSMTWVCIRSLAGIAGSSPAGNKIVFASVVCSQLEVSATVRSFIQRNPTECGLSVCDIETSSVRRPGPTRGLMRQEDCFFIRKYWRIRYLCVARDLLPNAIGLTSL